MCNYCTLQEQVIINLIKENSNIKQEEIVSTIGKSLRTIKTIMDDIKPAQKRAFFNTLKNYYNVLLIQKKQKNKSFCI